MGDNAHRSSRSDRRRDAINHFHFAVAVRAVAVLDGISNSKVASWHIMAYHGI